MIEPKDMTNEQLKNIDDFVRASILLKEDELRAMDGELPMTQAMFDHLSERLWEIRARNEFFRLLNEYPDFMAGSAERIEAAAAAYHPEQPDT